MEQGEQSGKEECGRKMLRRRVGMMENDVTRAAEDTQGGDEKIGGRDMV